MKFLLAVTVLASIDAQCLPNWDVSIDNCSYSGLVAQVQSLLPANCLHGGAHELQLALGATTEDKAKEEIARICKASYLPFAAITGEGNVFDKEYFDGGTFYNEGREHKNEYGITKDKLEDNPGARIKDIYNTIAQSKGISWPSAVSNFEGCELRAAMCCFVQDRQANDRNGNCATPYEDNCVNADPSDNTDICYVDMARDPTSSRVKNGFALFEHGHDDDSHCHGFAWAQDPSDPSARFKANNLFYISLYDHLYQRGYVRNVPGAPMCGCVEQMPVVTRADCTQIDINNEQFRFSYTSTGGLVGDIVNLKIDFAACQGADGKNNDLEAYYQRLVNEGKASDTEKEEFDKHIVGDTYCREAIDNFLDKKGLVPKPQCRHGYPLECGCEEVSQTDYRGYINVTEQGYTCMRWASQDPHSHRYTRSRYPDSGLVDNYCRNPSEARRTWCYTTDPNKRWDYCGVPSCAEETGGNHRRLLQAVAEGQPLHV